MATPATMDRLLLEDLRYSKVLSFEPPAFLSPSALRGGRGRRIFVSCHSIALAIHLPCMKPCVILRTRHDLVVTATFQAKKNLALIGFTKRAQQFVIQPNGDEMKAQAEGFGCVASTAFELCWRTG